MSDNMPEHDMPEHHTKHDMAEHHILIFRLLLEGYEITVFDGEYYSLARSRNLIEIINEVESVEEAEIFAYKHGDNKTHAWALVTSYGVAPDETVADHSTEPWLCRMMCEIGNSYYGD